MCDIETKPGLMLRNWKHQTRFLSFLLVALVWTSAPEAERFGYPSEEFAARRERLAKSLEQGPLLMFGATEAAPGVRFRQDNDFFYLTGNEALNAVLVMDVASGQSHLFMPKLSATQIRFEGGNWLEEADAAKKYGFASIQPLTALSEFVARQRRTSSNTLWMRLSDRDECDGQPHLPPAPGHHHHLHRYGLRRHRPLSVQVVGL